MRSWTSTKTAAAALLVLLTGVACSAADDGRSAPEIAATEVAQAYVEAIAAGDLDTVHAMTGPDVWESFPDSDLPDDIRSELPDADAHIEDAWVSLIGPDREAHASTYTFQASWTLDGLTGGDTFELRVKRDADPTRADSWLVTEALTQNAIYYSSSKIDEAVIGSTAVDAGESIHLWGYPGRYVVEAGPDEPDVKPLPVLLGIEDVPAWDEDLPMLGAELED